MFATLDQPLFNHILTHLPIHHDVDIYNTNPTKPLRNMSNAMAIVRPTLLSFLLVNKNTQTKTENYLTHLQSIQFITNPNHGLCVSTSNSIETLLSNHLPSLLSLDLRGCRFINDATLLEIPSACPFLTSLYLPHSTATPFTLHGIEEGICRLRHLTLLSIKGTQHDVATRELLARMLVSSLPLLLHLDLSIEINACPITSDLSSNASKIVTLIERIEMNSTFLDILSGKFAQGLSTLLLNGRRNLSSISVRRLLTFESQSLCVLGLNRCELTDPSLILPAIGTCVRLTSLSLHDSFATNTAWIQTST